MKVKFRQLPLFYIPFQLPLYIAGIIFLFYKGQQSAWLFVALLFIELSPIVTTISVCCFLGALLPVIYMSVQGFHYIPALFALGSAMNYIAVVTNDNRMPVFEDNLPLNYEYKSPFHGRGANTTNFKLFCDFIPFFGLIASIGDLFIWFAQVKILI